MLMVVAQERILKAKTRVFLSTLYIGKTEHELVRFNFKNPRRP